MGFSRVVAARGRWSALVAALGLAFAVTSIAATPAEARKRYGYKRHAVSSYAPPYAALVVDANSGRVLHAQNEHALRHPASVTKVMTLYMLFEQLEKGRFRLDSPLRVSARAAAMAPSKLGFDPGETIEVEDAIKALVTKSANDVAAAVAENVAGDEETFAEQMTRKARALGMSRTVFRNASGLPDPEQVTTAHDLAILGRAVQDRFPRYYKYFGTHTFHYGSAAHRNHNKLLGRIEGVDGIKTGYTRASGFNLLTSARRGGRHVIGVVLGGRSGRARDLVMANLVETQIARATVGRTSSMVAERQVEDAPARMALSDSAAMRAEPAAERPRAFVAQPAATTPAATPMAVAAVAAAQTQKVRPAVVSAPRPEADIVTTASVRTGDGASPRQIGAPRPAVAAATTPSPLRWVAGPTGKPTPPAAIRETRQVASLSKADAPPAKPAPAARPEPAKPEKDAKAARGKADKAEKSEKTVVARKEEREPTPKKDAKSGAVIQIGAIDDLAKANALLARARAESRSTLASAHSYTEKVQKGDATLYRARFAGLESNEAEAACRQLKRSGFSCFTTRN
ncbi:MAG: D-alanyl-D-alanine carboxypeptidase [Methylobacteriaceae bacterium]|nr:D-alanyl-D-alanine carboxypeptidase [Methylobacteriaceae bacterium]